jgi:hypothetical protein
MSHVEIIDVKNTVEVVSDTQIIVVQAGSVSSGGGGGTWGSITGTLSDQTDLQTALDGKVDENASITGATKTKITYDAKGLITAGADATTADIAASTNKNYVTDAQLTVIGNTSGTNTGDQDLSDYELLSNKATDLTTPDNTKYPTTLAVSNAISSIGSYSTGIYMFSGTDSDISGYESMPELSSFTAGSAATAAQTVTTTPTLLEEFATASGVPSLTAIPVGMFTAHYEVQKSAGSNNYYTYFELYKRASGGTETLLLTSDNSPSTALNTLQQVSVAAYSSSIITLLSTDRLVIKIYAVMTSSSATITLSYDDNTDARFTLPVSPLSYVPENVANKSTDGTLASDSDTLYPSESAVKEYVDYNDNILQSTGLINGGTLSINATNTLFDVAAGEGYVVDSTSYAAPTKVKVTWSAFTAQTVTNLATSELTYVLISAAGAIVQQTTYPTPEDKRSNIFIGRLNHENLTNISFTNTFPDLLQSPMNQFADFVDTIGPFSYQGNIVTANGTNLSFDKSAGKIYTRSINITTNNQSPSNKDTAALTAASFKYQTRNAPAASSVTVVDPTNYDLSGTITAVPGAASTTTVQRLFLFPSNTLKLSYGQSTYTNLANALANYEYETFVNNTTVEGIGVLIAYIVVQKNCTALNDATRAKIILAPRFGSSTGAGGGSNTLQQVYLNSAGDGITTDATNGAFSVKRGSAADTDVVLSVKNGAGTVNTSVDGNGKLTTASMVLGSSTGVLKAATGTVSVAEIVNADINASAAIAFSKLAPLSSANILVGNGFSVATSVPMSGDITINNSGATAIGSGVIVNADVNASAAIALSKLATQAAKTVVANATNATAVPTALASSGASQVLTVNAGNTALAFATLVDANISASAAIANSKLANVATSTIKGRVTGGTGVVEDLTATQATTILNTFTSADKGLAPASGGGTTNFLRADGTWTAPSGGSGTVTSVGMTVPSFLAVSPSTVTTAGTFAVTASNQNANLVFAGPSSGAAAAPTFRTLVAADIPVLNLGINGQSTSYTLVASDANKMIWMDSASAETITVPLSTFQTGDQILIMRKGAGTVTVVAASGVSISSRAGYLSLTDQYSAASLVCLDAVGEEWILMGDISP